MAGTPKALIAEVLELDADASSGAKSERASEILCNLLESEYGVFIPDGDLQRFILRHFRTLSVCTHVIHDAALEEASS